MTLMLLLRGVKVYGHRAIYSGSYTDIAEKEEYKTLVEKLWGRKSASAGINRYGEGAVGWGMTLTEALKETGLKPDVQMNRGDMKKDKIWFAHRRLKDADVYFLNNHTDQAVADTFSFRAFGKVAELWNPVQQRPAKVCRSVRWPWLPVKLILCFFRNINPEIYLCL